MIELLENRRLLSAAISFRNERKIQIITDTTDEQIIIRRGGAFVEVIYNGEKALEVEAGRVKQVSIWSIDHDGGEDFIDATGIDAALYFQGSNDAETVLGSAGSDTLYGFDGNDVLIGNAGDDFFHGGLGADVMRGKDGIDTVIYETAPSRVVVRLDNLPNDGVDDGAEGDNADGTIENIVGSAHGDRLYGNSRANTIKGEGGNDLIRGGRGNDQLWPGNGRDTVKGDAGFDTYLTLRDGRADRVIYGFNEDAVGEFDSGMDVIDNGTNSPF